MTPSCSPVKFVSSVVFTIKVSGYLHSACHSARSTCCCWETHVIVYTIRCKEGPTCSFCIIGPLGDSRNGMDWYLECSLAAFFSFACFSRMILRKLLRNERIKIQLSTTLIVVFERKEVDCLMSRAGNLSSGSKRSCGNRRRSSESSYCYGCRAGPIRRRSVSGPAWIRDVFLSRTGGWFRCQ